MKKIVSFALLLTMIISICIVNVGAVPAPHFYGDANCDRSVDVMDATEIQRCIAKFTELSLLGEILADVDADEEITVMDATMIQRDDAKIINGFNHKDQGIYTYIDFRNLTANFDSIKAEVGIPVTFSTKAYCDVGNPLSYQYEIYTSLSEEPIFVSERSDSPDLTYTFEKSGYYIINSNVYNIFGEHAMADIYYYVSENDGECGLMVSAVNQNQFYLNKYEDVIISANAYGGTEPYEYSFELSGYNMTQDFSENNTFNVGKLPLGCYSVTVTVRDADGNVDTSGLVFYVEEALC